MPPKRKVPKGYVEVGSDYETDAETKRDRAAIDEQNILRQPRANRGKRAADPFYDEPEPKRIRTHQTAPKPKPKPKPKPAPKAPKTQKPKPAPKTAPKPPKGGKTAKPKPPPKGGKTTTAKPKPPPKGGKGGKSATTKKPPKNAKTGKTGKVTKTIPKTPGRKPGRPPKTVVAPEPESEEEIVEEEQKPKPKPGRKGRKRTHSPTRSSSPLTDEILLSPEVTDEEEEEDAVVEIPEVELPVKIKKSQSTAGSTKSQSVKSPNEGRKVDRVCGTNALMRGLEPARK